MPRTSARSRAHLRCGGASPVRPLRPMVDPWRQVPRWPDPWLLDSRPRDLQWPPPSGSTADASCPRRDPPWAHARDGPASSSGSMGAGSRAYTTVQDGSNPDCFWKC